MTWSHILVVVLAFAATEVVRGDDDYSCNPAVQLFREYIMINTTSRSDMTPAVEFWNTLAEQEGLPIQVVEFSEGYPIIIIKWAGTDSNLTSIMLNSHMDVVPAVESDGWTYPPFSAELTSDGVIWGRGTQDMKSVSIQYFEALRNLKKNNVTMLRDVYMTIMPDEELGADKGMIPFLESEEFRALNVGMEMDEGAPYNLPYIPVFFQDKVPWHIKVECNGVAAHGSTFPSTNETATGKCWHVMNKLFEFRDEQYEIFKQASLFEPGSYTSVNLNRMSAGIADNIIPGTVTLVFDIRLGTNVDEEKFEAQLEEWMTEAGSNVSFSYIIKNHQSPATFTDSTNPYYTAMTEAAQDTDILIMPVVAAGSTDARFVRNHRIPAFGFSPMPNTELLLHSVNERLSASTFLKGIEVYEQIISRFANLPASRTGSDPSKFIYVTAGNEE